MKYYKIINSLKIKDIGVFPQSTTPKKYWDLSEVLNFDNTIKEEFVLPEIILEPKAKYTTLLSSVTVGSTRFLILKNYFFKFLDDFYVNNYRTWNLNIEHNTECLKEYSLFHLSNSMEKEMVNYKESNFYIGKMDFKPIDKNNIEYLNIENHNDYTNLYQLLVEEDTRKYILSDKLVLDFSKVKQDLIRMNKMPFLTNGYYVSEKLKNAIEENRFTGIGFKEVEAIDKRIEVKF